MNTFLEHINSTGKSFVDFALPMLIQSSVLIIILLGACRITTYNFSRFQSGGLLF